jgi:DNA-binding response OmpR family regulator
MQHSRPSGNGTPFFSIGFPFDVMNPVPPVSALIVEPTLEHVLPLVSTLSASSFQVTVAETFEEAKAVLASRPPAVLLTEIRLGEYNGLQLVLQGKSVRSDLVALVMSPVDDPVLQADAEKMGATFMVKPLAPREVLAALFRTMARTSETSTPLRYPFERRTRDRRAATTLDFQPDRRRTERRTDAATFLQRFAPG